MAVRPKIKVHALLPTPPTPTLTLSANPIVQQKHGRHAGGEGQARVGKSGPPKRPRSIVFSGGVVDRQLLSPPEGVGDADQGVAKQTGASVVASFFASMLIILRGRDCGAGCFVVECRVDGVHTQALQHVEECSDVASKHVTEMTTYLL